MIDCTDVTFTYDGTEHALDGVSLHVDAGEFVCVLGGNGSGKSTLAKHLNALLVPDEGTVRIDGHDTSDTDATFLIRSTAGMVFQNPDDQIVASLVENDIAFGPENLGVAPAEIRRRVGDALAEVGLIGFEDRETTALSGGQKQRVAIAGVLAMDPKILILDEATAMLDPRGRAGLMRVCKDLNARGMTIVMITHFMDEAAEADRIVVMNRGRIVAQGAPEDILTQADMLAELNLEMPFASTLSLDLARRGIDVGMHVHAPELECALIDRAHAEGWCEKAARISQPASSDAEGAPIAAGVAAADLPSSTAARENAAREADAGAPDAAGEASTAAAETDALVRIENVSFTYIASKRARAQIEREMRHSSKPAKWGNDPSETWALRDIDLTVAPGEFFGIAGHTGSGKSTLIQHLNGIVHPTIGRVLVHGLDIADKRNARTVRGEIGVVFQYPEHQLFAATVHDDVAFGPRNLGLDADEVERRIVDALARVGLDAAEIGTASPFELSGGQQRRVAFAGVLAMRPHMLVLDEPAAGLDPKARAEFLELIRAFHDQDGMSVVMVSHSMDDLARLCDRIAVMNEGRLFAVGTPAEIFLRGPELKSIGLGRPAAQRLAETLQAQGLPLDADVLYDEPTLVRAIADVRARAKAGTR
ncbi:cobalt ABC transporter, ATP-binding protein [Slackia sp. CM382]|uniref:energy-coupling factor transporter ATPase n=1 Tax=Slackia sp. CM382 TaxID=1111137 RepID=UPI00027C4F4F|nr:energy-coupling factor transporter ATPase [Slackia sp. CM382]EJU34838.1 cobalt ABC transporter, ATP-binding protein [Slackia sp. CM382]